MTIILYIALCVLAYAAASGVAYAVMSKLGVKGDALVVLTLFWPTAAIVGVAFLVAKIVAKRLGCELKPFNMNPW